MSNRNNHEGRTLTAEEVEQITNLRRERVADAGFGDLVVAIHAGNFFDDVRFADDALAADRGRRPTTAAELGEGLRKAADALAAA